MRIAHFAIMVSAVFACGSATPPTELEPQATNVVQATPLILEKNEGERRVARGWPGHPDPGETIILKVDRKNGGSSHLVFFTADLPPGSAIETHKHAPIFADRNGQGSFGRHSEGRARWRHGFHPCRHMDFRFEYWKGLRKPSVPLFSARFRGLHTRHIRS